MPLVVAYVAVACGNHAWSAVFSAAVAQYPVSIHRLLFARLRKSRAKHFSARPSLRTNPALLLRKIAVGVRVDKTAVATFGLVATLADPDSIQIAEEGSAGEAESQP